MTRRGGTLLRYLVAGVVNTLLTYAVYLALLRAMPYSAAYTVAFVLGVGFAYLLQSRFVFGAPASWRTFFAFPLVYVVQYVVGVVALRLLVETGVMTRELALFAVLLVTVPIGFALSRALFAWKRRRAAD
ncbi:MAG TPA: GtrA family protein [Casimicrobiaceae bacterium]|nr:GtrA family protein [Casimicrobiaceae bacterium]